MKYIITRLVFGRPYFVESNEAEYLEITRAIENLLEGLFLEEKLDIVIENYYEYEAELLSIAARMMIYQDENYFSMSNERNLICRRIANLMSACKMYLDQILHHINNIYGEASNKSVLIEKEKNVQYDNKLAFRIMEALRNYAQHRDFPIQSLHFSYQTVDIGEFSQLLHTVIPIIKIDILKSDNKFKRSVLEELIATKNIKEIDIRPIIREYIECIGMIHEKIREQIKPDIEKWENSLYRVINKFQEEVGIEESLAGLSLIIENEDGEILERKPIYKDFLEKRKLLENKNRLFINLHKRYVTNHVRDKE